MKIVITGGHHTSALPIIHKLKSQLDDLEIMWIGHKYSVYGDKSETLEYKEISALGIDFFDLKAGKLYKTFDPIRLAKIPFGFVQAFYFLLKIKPDVIMSFGGYLAAPVVLAGWVLRIPSLTHEQTVVVGYANKFISKLVRKILVSWARSQKYFPKSKTVLTGLPLRNAIFSAHTERFNVNPDLPTVYITGGKTGSHILNESVYDV